VMYHDMAKKKPEKVRIWWDVQRQSKSQSYQLYNYWHVLHILPLESVRLEGVTNNHVMSRSRLFHTNLNNVEVCLWSLDYHKVISCSCRVLHTKMAIGISGHNLCDGERPTKHYY